MKSKEVEIDGKTVTICWDDDTIIDVNVKPSVEVDGDVPPFVARDLTIGSNGEIVAAPCVTSFRVQPTADGWALESFAVSAQTKPTMAEIERLMKGLVAAAAVDHPHNRAYWDNVYEKECALMAAIRQLSNSTQDGE